MLYDILIFLPAFMCLFWIVIVCAMASRTSTFQPMLVALVMMMLYIFTDSCYASPNASPRMLVATSILAQISAPSVMPVIWLYLMRLHGQQNFRASQMLWLVFPAMLGAASLLLTLMAGPERVMSFQTQIYSGDFQPSPGNTDPMLYAYYIVTAPLFRSSIIFELLFYAALTLVLIHKNDFRARHLGDFFGGKRIRVLEIQVLLILLAAVPFLPKMILTHAVLMEHPWISAVLAVLITLGINFFCYVSLFGARKSISLHEMQNGFRYNYNRRNRAEAVEEMMGELIEDAGEESLRRIHQMIGNSLHYEERPPSAPASAALPASLASGIFSSAATSRDDNSLLSRFEQLMLHERAFLEPGLTLGDVAVRLHSNKTYVSRLVNNTYDIAFPDLINTLRVDYAEQYIVQHRSARQNEVASACGFTSASSFNNTFKKVTGMTPKIWLATFDREHPAPRQSVE